MDFKTKTIFSIFLWMLSLSAVGQSLTDMRGLLLKAKDSEKVALEMIDIAQKSYEETKNPTLRGYEAVGYLFMSKHSFSPFKKIGYLKDGKKLLDNTIKNHPEIIELRLLRLRSQQKIPKILGYNDSIETDRSFLGKEYQNIEDSELKNMVQQAIKD